MHKTTKEIKEKIKLLIAQSAPFTLLRLWKDADFEHLEEGMQKLIDEALQLQREEIEKELNKVEVILPQNMYEIVIPRNTWKILKKRILNPLSSPDSLDENEQNTNRKTSST